MGRVYRALVLQERLESEAVSRRCSAVCQTGVAVSTVTISDVERAALAIEGAVARTPSAVSLTLSEILGATVVLKFEIFQFTAAFKERGARNRLLALTEDERAAGVVAVSAGNHAQAVAH